MPSETSRASRVAEMVKNTSRAVDTIWGIKKRRAETATMAHQALRGARQRSGSSRRRERRRISLLFFCPEDAAAAGGRK